MKLNLTRRWIMPLAVVALLASASSAYALFSSTISFGNISMTVGNSALQVQLPDGTWVGENWTSGYTMTGLYPGLSTSADFKVKNASTAPIALEVSAQLVSAGGDFEALKDAITVRVHPTDNTRSSTGYKTLTEWNAEGGIKLPGGSLAQGETRDYTMDIEIDTSFGNELAGKSLNDVQVALTAAQDN